MPKLCILCRKGPREVPDRNVIGRPTKKVCKKCHADRLVGDVRSIMELVGDMRSIMERRNAEL